MAARVSRSPARPPSTSPPERVEIPAWDLDPVWSLQPWPLVVRLAGHELEVPAMPASDWLAIFMNKDWESNDLFDLIPGLDDVLYESTADLDEIREMLLDVITTVSSRHWWITLRLISAAMRNWDTLGPTMVSKVDATKVSFAAWVGYLQVLLIESMEPRNAKMFIAQVQNPPIGTEAPVSQQKELTAREFLAMAG